MIKIIEDLTYLKKKGIKSSLDGLGLKLKKAGSL